MPLHDFRSWIRLQWKIPQKGCSSGTRAEDPPQQIPPWRFGKSTRDIETPVLLRGLQNAKGEYSLDVQNEPLLRLLYLSSKLFDRAGRRRSYSPNEKTAKEEDSGKQRHLPLIVLVSLMIFHLLYYFTLIISFFLSFDLATGMLIKYCSTLKLSYIYESLQDWAIDEEME